MRIAFALLPFVALSAAVTSQSSHGLSKGLTQRLLKDTKSVIQQRRRRTQADGNDEPVMCDAALGQCMGEVECLKCFTDLKENEVNWASVTSGLPCEDALKTMYDAGHCTALQNLPKAESAFCVAFNACIRSQETTPSNPSKNATAAIDCDKLETCDFPGIHKQFLGDGICNDKLPGCYNHAICGYDKVSMRFSATERGGTSNSFSISFVQIFRVTVARILASWRPTLLMVATAGWRDTPAKTPTQKIAIPH